MSIAPGSLGFQQLNSSPATPPAGFCIIYSKTDNVLYLKDSSGVEVALGSASAITSLTGEATGTGPGATSVTLSNSAVIGKVLTGFSSGPNSIVLSTDTLLQAIQKLQAQITASSGSAITALTGDVSAAGPGSAAATVNSIGGSSAANVHNAELAANAATAANTASTIVKRDASGNFSANIITASLTGNATTATSATSFSGSLSGDVTGTQSATVVSSVGGSSATNVHTAELAANAATSSNTPSTIVKRDASGNFSAGTISAGSVSATGTISGSNFSGSSSGTNTGDVTLGTANGLSLLGQALSLGLSSSSTTGALSSADWTTFNSKISTTDNRLSTTNVVKVKKNPGSGEFLTLELAMASITTNSITNPFVIEVGPGIYVVDNSLGPLVLKPYVTVVSDGQYSVILQAQDPTQDLFLVNNPEAILRDVIIENVNGPVAAAIRITRSEVPFLLDHVKFINCTESIVLEATSFPVEVAARSVRMVSGADTIRFTRIVSSLAQAATLRVYSSLWTEDDGSSFIEGIFVSGAGARLDANTLLMRSTTGTGNGIRVNNAGELVSQSGVEIEGFDQNLYSENSGAAPHIRTTVIMLRNGITWDLNIAHPGTTGSLKAKVNTETGTFIDPAAPIKLVLTDPSTSNSVGLFVKGDILQADRFDRKANLSLIARSTTTLGLLDDGGGSITVVSGLQVNVAAGNGFLDDPTDIYLKQITWPSTNLTLSASNNLFVYVDTDSIIQVNTVLPSFETVIPLGRVVTDASSINFIEHSALIMNHIGNKTEDMLRDAIGPVFSNGAIVTENATPRKLDVTAGEYFYGTNDLLITGGSAITWESIYRDGSSGFILGTQSTADNALYDNGTGTLASLTTSYYAKHTLYAIGDNGAEKYFLVYSQNQYVALIDAQNAPLPLVPLFISGAVTQIAGIIVQQGQTNIVSTIDLRPRIGFAAPATTAASDHGNLTGLLDDDHPQYLNRTGVHPMTGPLTSTDTTQSTNKDTGSIITEGGLGVEKNINAGGNINAVGTVTGSNLSGTNTGNVTITDTNSIDLTLVSQALSADLKLSSDAADAGNIKATTTIHADGLHVEMPFDTPSQIGTTNFAGSGPNIAAANHVHAHGNQTSGTLHAAVTTSVNGFMIAADKAKLDTVSATAATNTQILISDGTTYNPRTVSSDATITNAGALTVNSVGTSSSTNIHTAELAANAATNLNTASTIVKRDASGNFVAGTITANLTGNVSGTSANVTGVVAIANGGTNASTASSARVNLNIDERSTFSNAPYTVLSTDRYVGQTGTMSATRIVTLPAASSVNAGQTVTIADESGTVTTTNLLTITPVGADTINGSATKTIRSAYGYIHLYSNGTNQWFAGVEGIGRGGTGLSSLPTDGQLLIGSSTNSNYALASLTAGTGISITNASGAITIISNQISPNVTKTANYTILSTDGIIFVDTTSGGFTLTLPDPTALAGKMFRLIGTSGTMSANNLTLARFGSEKIEGLAASKILQTNWGWFNVTTNGTDWFVG